MKPNSSTLWRGIKKCRQVLNLFRKWLLGDGTSIHFCLDRWVGSEPFLSQTLLLVLWLAMGIFLAWQGCMRFPC